jgi:hypothetical protein
MRSVSIETTMRLFLFCFIAVEAKYNGFNFFPFNSTALAMPDTLNSLKIIAATGSNWVGVNFFLRQYNSTSNDVYFEARTPTRDVWSAFIQEAHKNNFHVLLKPLVVCGGECLFINIIPDNITNWFSSYGQVIYNLSIMAKELDIDALSVGLELMKISNGNYTSYWRTLIKSIRTGGYSGLLTYCSIFYPVETQNIDFWDELDFIGMDFYLPLLNITNNGSIPSQQDMTRRLSGYFQFFKLWFNQQPANVTSIPIVFTEVGYPSSLAGLAIPSGDAAAQCTGNYSANFTLQDMAFKALFQVLNDNKGLCDGTIIFWWDNPSSSDYYNEKDSNNWGCSWTVRGKPAECTIADAFGGTCSINRSSSININNVILICVKLFFCFILLFGM